MASPIERLALAEAIQLHDERVRMAAERSRYARSDLDAAEANQRAVIQAQKLFLDSIRNCLGEKADG